MIKRHGSFFTKQQIEFKAVLESFTNTEIPIPTSGVWANAGMVRGIDVDIAWRLLDARYWGKFALAQRRRRIFLVADFEGSRATEILFKARDLQSVLEKAGCPFPLKVEYILKKQGRGNTQRPSLSRTTYEKYS